MEYTEKKTSVFQIQLEFWVNMTLWFWMMYPPPTPETSWILSELQLFQSFSTKVAQNDSEWTILPNSQLFQSFPTEVAQNDLEWPILPNLQLFQSFPTEVAQNDLEWPILPNLQLFQSFPTKVAQNDSEWPLLPVTFPMLYYIILIYSMYKNIYMYIFYVQTLLLIIYI